MKPFYLRAISPIYVLLLPAVTPAAEEEWPVYGHDLGGARYSPLSQITPGNVHPLKQVREFHTGDFTDDSGDSVRSGFETTPLLVGAIGERGRSSGAGLSSTDVCVGARHAPLRARPGGIAQLWDRGSTSLGSLRPRVAGCRVGRSCRRGCRIRSRGSSDPSRPGIGGV